MNTLTQEDKASIVSTLNISHLTEDNQNEIISRLDNIIMTRLAIEISKVLTEEEKKLIESDNPDAISQKKIKDFESLAVSISKDVVFEFKKKTLAT